MLFHYSVVLASLSFLPVLVSSYQIHQSCVDKGIAITVRDGMTSAFEMADSALRHLEQNPYDRDTADLVKRLFLPKNGQNVDDRDKMGKVRLIFRNIIRYYGTEIGPFGNLKSQDMVIYCDDSRYVDEGNRDKLQRKLYRDTMTNTEVLYNRQSCHDPGAEWVALMVTDKPDIEVQQWNDHIQDHVNITLAQPTVTMICPWFIDWIKMREYTTSNEVMRSNIGRFVVKKAEGNKGLRQIDALSLLDKVLLHEMTHGRMSFISLRKGKSVEGTDDVDVPPNKILGIPIPWPPVRTAYGWMRARALALRGDDVVGLNGWSAKAPDHNADSIALFGSAAKLLDHEWPRRVLDDGSLWPIGV